MHHFLIEKKYFLEGGFVHTFDELINNFSLELHLSILKVKGLVNKNILFFSLFEKQTNNLLKTVSLPAGHEHSAWWLPTEHRALAPQGLLAHGSVHLLLIHAWFSLHVAEERQPSLHVTPWQISSELQSSSNLEKEILVQILITRECILDYNFENYLNPGRSPICPTFDSCDVIKMREMRGEVGKKTPKKRWIIPHFYDVTAIKCSTDWASSNPA